MANKFLEIKSWMKDGKEYFYAERLGVDSVAFILHDKNLDKFGLIHEFKPPIDDFLDTAFGGSIDKNKSYLEIVKEEVHEEAGYIVEDKDVTYLGKVFVSTQMNQFANLYYVDITKSTEVDKIPQNDIEKLASVIWLNKEEIVNGQDWKSITILTKMNLL